MAQVLDRDDLRSPTWARIESHLRDRLAELRERNDADADEARTAKTRGRIAELKELLALAHPEPDPTGGEGDDVPLAERP